MNGLLCSYCGSHSSIANSSKTKFKKFITQKKLSVRIPICGRCWNLILNGQLSESASSSDIQISAAIEDSVKKCNQMSKSTSLDDLLSLSESIDGMCSVLSNATADFNQKANEAARAADRVSRLESFIDKMKYSVSEKFKSNYESCRSFASRYISNPELRDRVFRRDGFKCATCGSVEYLSVDHIHPVIKGGGNEDDNLQTLCLPCNLKKGSK